MTVFGASKHTWRNRARELNHRARKAGVEGTISASQLIEIVRRDEGRCYHCDSRLSYRALEGAPLSRKAGSFDHLEPLVRGGTHFPFNLVCSCRGCNNRRGCRPFVVSLEAA